MLNHNGNLYFLPLTSSKRKHLGWSDKTSTNYILYERLEKKSVKPELFQSNFIYKEVENGEKIKHLLAVLEIKKMIPVPNGKYDEIDMDRIENASYRELLEKEIAFLRPLKKEILKKATKIYEEQIESGLVKPFYCNYRKLEEICNQYAT